MQHVKNAIQWTVDNAYTATAGELAHGLNRVADVRLDLLNQLLELEKQEAVLRNHLNQKINVLFE
jgi:hypothetical protein